MVTDPTRTTTVERSDPDHNHGFSESSSDNKSRDDVNPPTHVDGGSTACRRLCTDHTVGLRNLTVHGAGDYLPVWKSDRFGERRFMKFLKIPTRVYRSLSSTMVQAETVDREMRSFKNGMYTKHSIRKGAINILAQKYTPEQIIQLTGHTPVVDTMRRLSAYIRPAMHHPMGILKQEMSSFLITTLLA